MRAQPPRQLAPHTDPVYPAKLPHPSDRATRVLAARNGIRLGGVLLLLAAAALAQQPAPVPHIGYVYPAGGRQGSTFEVEVGGQALNGVSYANLTGPGAQVRIVEYERPMTGAQATTLREEMQGLQKKRQAAPAAFPASDLQRMIEIRDKLAKFIRRPMNPAIAETVRVEVTLATDAAPGRREFRMATPNGMTNPLVFQVGSLPEWSRKPAEAINAPGIATAAQARNITPSTTATEPVEIALPVVVNGQIMPGAVDRYRFTCTKGQRLIVAASARELIPYISDAVPGWFQAVLSLRDSAGREVQYADHDAFRPDPVLSYEVPSDGAYTLEIKDSIYRGREDFVYRITVNESGKRAPVSRVVAKDRDKQKVKIPAVVTGCIDRPGDWDVYRFDGRKGEEIVADIVARRQGSPLDSVLRLTDAKGKELAVNDDTEDKGSGLLTHHADSHMAFKLPAKGTYYVYVGDSQKKGGTNFQYRLRVSRPQPDFELRVTPSGINARSGGATPVTVYAIRRDGFDGEIALELKEAPPGFKLDGAAIPPGRNQVRVTLTAPVGLIETPAKLTIEGRATVAGRELRRTAIAADDMLQAFYYHHLTPASDLLVRVVGPQRPPVMWRPVSDKPVRLVAGGETSVQIAAPLQRLGGPVLMTLNEPPEGIAIQSVTPGRESVSVVFRVDPAKAKPGLKGNLILDAFVERPVPNAKQPQARRRQPLGTLPAAAFEVVER